ncbi:MAG: hypothetical protein ACE366_01565 [Bradymonadia bacterium]
MRSLFIVAFLAAQLYLPLSYYMRPDPLPELIAEPPAEQPVTLPEGADPFDERFAWRMFSPIRMVKCDVSFYDATDGVRRRVPTGKEVHFLWINLFKRARRSVIDQFAQWRCPQMATEGKAPILNAEIVCPVRRPGRTGVVQVRPFDPTLNLCDPS